MKKKQELIITMGSCYVYPPRSLLVVLFYSSSLCLCCKSRPFHSELFVSTKINKELCTLVKGTDNKPAQIQLYTQ